jgi:hypothetical protein
MEVAQQFPDGREESCSREPLRIVSRARLETHLRASEMTPSRTAGWGVPGEKGWQYFLLEAALLLYQKIVRCSTAGHEDLDF